MAYAEWMVSVMLRFATNGPQVMERLTASTKTANAAIAKQAGLIDANTLAASRYTAQIERVQAAQRRFGMMVSGGVAIAGGALIGTALTSAAKLQLVLQSIQNVSGANTRQMEQVYRSAFNIGATTNMTPVQTAEMFREIVRQTQGAMPFSAQLGTLPYAAKFAQVMGAVRNMSPTESVDSAINLMHLFRQYDASGMGKMFDTILRMGELMPSNLSQAVRQMTYFEPTLKNLNVPDDVAATLMVFLSRAGFGKGKGGTGLQRLVEQAVGPLQMTAHLQRGKAALLGRGIPGHPGLGVLDAQGRPLFYHATGGLRGGPWFDAFGFLGKLAAYAQRYGRVEATRVFTSVFGQQGGRIAQLVADPVLVQQLSNIEAAMTKQKSLGLSSQQRSISNTLAIAASQAWKNFFALFTELGSTYIPQATTALQRLGDQFHRWQTYLHDHRGLERFIGVAVSGVTAFAGLRTVLAAGTLAARAFGASIGAIPWTRVPLIPGVGGGKGRLVRDFTRAPALGKLFDEFVARGFDILGIGWLVRLGRLGLSKTFEGLWTVAQKMLPFVSRLGIASRVLVPALEGFSGALSVLADAPFTAVVGGIAAMTAGVVSAWRLLHGKQTPLPKGAAPPVFGGDGVPFEYLPWANPARSVPRVHVPVARPPYQTHGLPMDFRGSTLNIMLPPGTTEEQAKALAEHLHPQHVMQIAGVHRTSARLPKPLSIGNTLFAH